MHTCHLYIFFGELSVKVFHLLFKIWVICFLIIEPEENFLDFGYNPLPDVPLANIFSSL